MTFYEALKLAREHGEKCAEQASTDGAPKRLPPEIIDGLDLANDARIEALHGRMREAFWMHRYYAKQMEALRLTNRLEAATWR